MENNFDMVAEELFSEETSADDTQTAVSAAELMRNLTEETDEAHETVENNGDDAQRSARNEEKAEQKDDKVGKRIRAALANQKKQLYAELGGTEEEIREIMRAYKAQKLTQDNPKISPEAAKIIVEEREKAQSVQPATNSETVAAIQSLIDDGWTREMLQAFVQDEIVREQINEEGVSVRKAAFAYLNRKNAPQKTAKKSVPTLRTATAAGTTDSDRIEEMTDAEFEAFSRRAREAAMSGKKVKF